MPGPSGRENRPHAGAGFGALPNDPIAILAHDGDAIEDNRLAGRQERNRFVPVELPRQLEVDVGHEGILARRVWLCRGVLPFDAAQGHLEQG